MIVVAGVGIRSDMRIQQKGLPILDQAVGVPEIGLALADRLDLAPAQSHARLVLFEEEVVVARLAVLGRVACPGSYRIARFGLRRRGLYGMAGGSGHKFGRNSSSYIVAGRSEYAGRTVDPGVAGQADTEARPGS